VEDKGLAERRKSLEEDFFAKENERLRVELRDRRERESLKAGLRLAGITSDPLLDRLIDLGIAGEAVAALGLVPLVAVAWADGTVDDRERDAVLRAARDAGLAEDQPGFQLLRGWLAHAPEAHLLEVWGEYVRALCAELEPDRQREFREQLLGRTRAVAEAAGGFLGLTSKISAREQAVIAELERAFGAG